MNISTIKTRIALIIIAIITIAQTHAQAPNISYPHNNKGTFTNNFSVNYSPSNTGGAAIGNTAMPIVKTYTLSENTSGGIAVYDKGDAIYFIVRSSIRKLTISTGVITDIAGSEDNYGYMDGIGTSALFNGPGGITIDAAGANLYVTDAGNHRIRKIVIATKNVITLAGSSSGYADGIGTAAKFNNPGGITIDAPGTNLYVTDINNKRVRKIVIATQNVTTLAGSTGGYADGIGNAAKFSDPTGITIDAAGANLYVADMSNYRIRKIELSTNTVSTYAGSGNFIEVDGTGTAASFIFPFFLNIDNNDNIYVSPLRVVLEPNIRKIEPGGRVTTLNVDRVNNTNVDKLILPLTSGKDFAIFYKTSSSSNDLLVRIVSTIGSPVTTFSSGLNQPNGIATDAAGNSYVADYGSHTILKINAAGVKTILAGSNGIAGNAIGTGTAARFTNPSGVALDAAGANLYVADYGNHCIRKINLATVAVTTFAGTAGISGNSGSLFNNPRSVAVDKTGNVYVADFSNNLIRKITAAGAVSSLATVFFPMGVAVDTSGNIYVPQYLPSQISKVTQAGVVSVFAGDGNYGFQNGTGNSAKFNAPTGVAVDVMGNILVADYGNNAIRKITPSGIVTTLAGNGFGGNTDGNGTFTSFKGPSAISCNPATGKMYVADNGNNLIRSISPDNGFYIYPNSLPTGLSFDGTSGKISGTPTVLTASAPYTVTAYNQSGSSTANLNLSVVPIAQPGNALNFDGTNDFVQTTVYGSQVKNNFTLEAWVMPKHPTKTICFLSTREPQEFTLDAKLDAGNKILVDCGDGAGTFGNGILSFNYTYTVGKWMHIAITYNGTACTVYVNGVSLGTQTTNITNPVLFATNSYLKIGSVQGVQYFDGNIDEVRIWNVTRTAAQIQANWEDTVARNSAGLIAYYRLDDGVAGGNNTSITTALNLTGTGMNGSFQGMALTGIGSNYVESYAMVVPVVKPATLVGTTSFQANWDQPMEGFSDDYVVDISTDSTFATGVRSITVYTSADTLVTGLNSDTKYFYRVRAEKASVSGQGAYSQTISVTTLTPPLPPPGDALNLDGVNDYVRFPANITTDNQSQTIEFWARIPGSIPTANNKLFIRGEDGNGSGWSSTVYVSSNGALNLSSCCSGGGTVTSGTKVVAGKWYHIAAVYNSANNTQQLYINGNLEGSSTGWGPFRSSTVGYQFGRGNGNEWINESIDEVRIWTTARTAAEIKAGMKDTVNTASAGLAAYYRFDDGDAGGDNTNITAASDITGNGKDGILSGLALTGSTSNIVKSYAMIVPTIAAATAVNSVEFIANWTAPLKGKVDSFRLEVSPSSSFTSFITGFNGLNIAGTSTSQLVTGLTAGTKYYYRVSANDTSLSGQGGYSDTMSVTTTPIAAPVINYTSPNSFTANVAITPLTPSVSGGAITGTSYVGTIAGGGTDADTTNGIGTDARFNGPTGIVRDATGNLYIADQTNNTIRKITPAGVVSTFAGKPGEAGTTDGSGSTARFNQPRGLAIDANGNLFVADYFNHLIRKITSAAVVSTIAGKAGVPDSTEGNGTAAGFNFPSALAVDGSGNIYVADQGNNKIRKITSAGVVSTLAGAGNPGDSTNGIGNAAKFKFPLGIAIDATGTNLYVADGFNYKIRKIVIATGAVTTYAGNGNTSSTDGSGSVVSFAGPVGVAVDASGNVFVAEFLGNKIRKITPAGIVSTYAGTGVADTTDGISAIAAFKFPAALTADALGNIYVADYGNNRIRRIGLVNYSITPALPAGLKLDSATGIISGTPTVVTAQTDYTVTAYNAGGGGSKIVKIEVLPFLAAPNITYTPQTNVFALNSPITALTPVNTGGTVVSYSISPALPIGLSFNTTTGVISGTPTVVTAATNYTVIATNTKGTSQFVISIATQNLPVITYSTPKIYAVGVAIPTLSPTNTGGTVTSYSISPALPVGLNLNTSNGQITGTPTVVTAATNYTVTATGTAGNGTFVISITTMNLPTISYTPSANSYVINIPITNLTPVTTGATSFSISPALPAGLNFNTSTGVISGTPTAMAVAANYTVTATNAAGNATVILNIAVNAAASTPDISYTPSTNSFPIGTAITPLVPVNIGAPTAITQPPLVSDYAGTGVAGLLDGLRNVAKFWAPGNLASDANGNIFVPEILNNVIRRVDTSLGVVTIAGDLNGAAGSTDGAYPNAKFDNPSGIAVDAGNNIYVADGSNNKIRKIVKRLNQSNIVSTFAGSGAAGGANGTGTNATFNYPSAIGTDASGNVYVADINNKIRKITPAGVVSDFIGSGNMGITDGVGAAANINTVLSMTSDATNLYFTDQNTIRKINLTTKQVTTIAGGANTGSADGVGIAASFNSPNGLAISKGGDLYIADANNYKIRVMNLTSGQVTTYAGDGTNGATNGSALTANFKGPTGLAFDVRGNLYVSDGNKIRMIKPAVGPYSITPVLPPGLTFDTFTGVISGTPLAASSATTYTITASNAAGSKPTTISIATTVAGGLPNISYTPNTYSFSVGTAIASPPTPTNSGGAASASSDVLVSNFAGDPNGVAGNTNGTGSAASFTSPYGVVTDASGNAYVSDNYGSMIRKITPAGVVSTFAGSINPGTANGSGGSASFDGIKQLAIDASGNLYVADANNNKIRKVTSGGVVTTLAGSGIAGANNGINTSAQFDNPSGVAVDAAGNVYVADANNGKIRKITTGGIVSDFAGSGNEGGMDGTGIISGFYNPIGLAIDASGNLYVADNYNNKIRKITPAAVVTTFAGSGIIDSANGYGTNAGFNYPEGLSIDAAGNLYVADVSNSKIRKITSTGVVTTYAGNGNFDSTNGSASQAAFYAPPGVAVDAFGNVYVSDNGNNKIRKITAIGHAYSITPALPAGLTFNVNTGAISGIPTVVTSATPYTVTAYNANGNTNCIVTISTGALNKPIITYPTPISLELNQSISTPITPTNTGGAVNVGGYSISPNLPTGLTFNINTGAIGGTPVFTTAAANYTVSATNAGGTGTFVINIAVLAKPVITYTTPDTLKLNAAMTALNPNTSGGGAVSSYSINPALPAGLSLAAATGIISGIPTVTSNATSYTVTATNAIGTGTFIINITVMDIPRISYTPSTVVFATGTAISPLNPTTNTGGAISSYSVSPALPTGLSINTSTGIISGIPTTTTAATPYTVTATNKVGTGTFIITISTLPKPVISYTTPDTLKLNAAMTALNPNSTGGTVQSGGYSINPALPVGLSIDANTGIISGIPTVTSNATNYTVTATNAAGTGTFVINITVMDVPHITYTPATVILATGTAITNLTPANTGGAVSSYSVSPALPTGLSINTSTGVISGIPTTTTAATPYTVTATNKVGTGTFVITISTLPKPVISYTTPDTLKLNAAMTALNPNSTGGAVQSGGYSVSPALPTGLSMDANTGILSGIPTVTSNATNYTVTATNVAGTGTFVINITVMDVPHITYTPATVILATGTAITNLTPANTGGAVSSYSVSPALPTGLSLNTSTGIISGIPTTTTAATPYTVTATNKVGTGTFIITISTLPKPVISYTTPDTLKLNAAMTALNPNSTGGAVQSGGYSVSPALPAGLSIDANTGILSGIPTVTSNATNYTVTATNAAGTGTFVINITVMDIPRISYTPSTVVFATGTAISPLSPTTNTGGAISSYSISPALPAGLSLNTSTGVISGIPTVTSPAHDYTITATNKVGTGTFIINITTMAKPVISYTTPDTLKRNAAITPLNPNSTGGTVQSGGYSISPALPVGLSIDANTGIISGIPFVTSNATDYTVTATNAAGSGTFVVNITVMDVPRFIYGIANIVFAIGTPFSPLTPTNNGGGPISSFSINPALPAGLNINTSTGVISGIPTIVSTATDYTITGTNKVGTGTFVINITTMARPVITYTPSTNVFLMNSAISNLTPSNTGGAATGYSVSPALPTGLVIDAATGVISGTPTLASSTADYTVTATNQAGIGTFVINIAVLAKPIINYSSATYIFATGTAISNLVPTNTGGAVVSYSINPALPTGLNFNTSTGVISGTPTTITAANNYTITATNAVGNGTFIINIKIAPPPPIINYISLTNDTFNVGVPVSPVLNPTNTGGAVSGSNGVIVSDFAGNYRPDTTNGTLAQAAFNNPTSLAKDAAGNIFVADVQNNQIRKITPAGIVSVFAGNPTAGNADGQGTAASFNKPYGVATDAAGNVYVADFGNNTIRKITATGMVTTLAGSGVAGSTNGQGILASFNSPTSLVLDNTGNIYVTDQGNNKIRKITPTGLVSSYAGSNNNTAGYTNAPTGPFALFNQPTGIAIDAAGNLYVADKMNNSIRRITSTNVSTYAGHVLSGSIDAPATLARFFAPTGVTVDASGNIYVTDDYNSEIRKIYAGTNPLVVTIAGNGVPDSTNGQGCNAAFNSPSGILVDATGNLLVADAYNNKIRKITMDGYAINPALPAGLSIDNSTGIISGTAIGASPATKYTITAFNEGGSGSTFDTLTVIPSLLGDALIFDGVDDYIKITNSNISPAYQSGYDFWIRPLASSNNMQIFEGHTGLVIQPDGAVLLTQYDIIGNLRVTNRKIINPNQIKFGQWNHIAVSISRFDYNTQIIQTFLNGIVTDIFTFSCTTDLGITVNGFSSTTSPFKGSIDEFRVWWSSPSPSLLPTIRFDTIDPNIAGLRAYYRFDQIAGNPTKLKNLSTQYGAALDGTLNNFALTGNTSNWTESYAMAVPIVKNVNTITRTSFVANWSAPKRGRYDKYILDVATDSLFTNILTGYNALVVNDTTQLVSGLTLNTPYYYRVRTDKASVTGQGCYSDVMKVITAISSPNISYSPNSYTYPVGTAISPVIPVNTGGAVVGTSNVYTSNVLAGSTRGNEDGTGSAAKFNGPNGITIDTSENIYVTDLNTGKIRKITPSGVVTTFGSGNRAIACDSDNNLYLYTGGITKLTQAGVSSTYVSSAVAKQAMQMSFDAQKNLYVADVWGNLINKVTPAGVVSPFATAVSASLNTPTGIVVDATGNVYVADNGNNVIKKITQAGVVTTYATGLFGPSGITIDPDGNLYVAEWDKNDVVKISPIGVKTQIATGFKSPNAITIDPEGNIYVADHQNNVVRKLSPYSGYNISPALPAGLVMDNATGIISGTPVEARAATVYTITAYNSGGSSTTKVTITTTSSSQFNIAGRVINPSTPGKLVTGATMSLKGSTTASTLSASGVYGFNNLFSGNYTIKGSKNNDKTKNNGISSIDVILTQNHILNKAPFTNPYKIIAADVNNDKKVSNIDVIFMKRLILGLDTTFAGNRLWAFVDSAYTFPIPSNPFPYKDSINYVPLNANKSNQTFIGIKLGDIDFNWNAAVAKPSKANNTPVELYYTDYWSDASKASDLIRIPIRVRNFKELLGLQYTLNFNHDAYEYVGIENNALKMDFNDGQSTINDGHISFLWADANSNALTLKDGTLLFELVLKPKSDNRLATNCGLFLSDDIAMIEAVDKDLVKHDVILTNDQRLIPKDSWSVSPNPTTGNVKVKLLSATDKPIHFELTNAGGKLVMQQNVDAIRGDNSFMMNLRGKTQLPAGVYYLTAVGMEGEKTKQVVIQ